MHRVCCFVLCCLLSILPYILGQQMPGGVGPARQPSSQEDPDVKVIASDNIRQAFTQQTGIKPKEFFVVSYATQVVAGTNYFAKVRIGENQYAHLRVFQPLPYTKQPVELHGVQTGKALADPLGYFDSRQDPTPSPTGRSAGDSDGSIKNANEANRKPFGDFLSVIMLFCLTIYLFLFC